jgi:hypothetical protein
MKEPVCGKISLGLWHLSSARISGFVNLERIRLLALNFEKQVRVLKNVNMNILKIVVALVCAYGLFVSVSYLLMRLIFPKIQVEEDSDVVRPARTRSIRRVERPFRKQKNLAY